MFTYSIKRAREIRKFHVAVVQRRLRNVQKSVMHVQSCCFANLNLLLFCRSLWRRHSLCLSSLLLTTKNFVTIITWHHTSSIAFNPIQTGGGGFLRPPLLKRWITSKPFKLKDHQTTNHKRFFLKFIWEYFTVAVTCT